MQSTPDNQAILFRELALCSEIIDALLHSESMPTRLRPPALQQAVELYPRAGGKRLRPALTMWCCALVGGEPQQARRAALAVELFHTYTLVHDDIIDGDATRRGQPSCHVASAAWARRDLQLGETAAAAIGTHLALLAGDLQQAWAINTLSRCVEDGVSAEVTLQLIRELSGQVSIDLLSGEALDVVYADSCQVDAAAIEAMLHGKTAMLLAFAARAGVRIGLNSAAEHEPRLDAAAAFAASAGLAFQLHDDYLGMFADAATLGKPVGADLAEGKQTLLLAMTRERADASQRRRLDQLVGKPGISVADLAFARELMQSSGAVTALQQRADTLIAAAHQHLANAFAPNRYRQLLHAWIDYVVQRQR